MSGMTEDGVRFMLLEALFLGEREKRFDESL